MLRTLFFCCLAVFFIKQQWSESEREREKKLPSFVTEPLVIVCDSIFKIAWNRMKTTLKYYIASIGIDRLKRIMKKKCENFASEDAFICRVGEPVIYTNGYVFFIIQQSQNDCCSWLHFIVEEGENTIWPNVGSSFECVYFFYHTYSQTHLLPFKWNAFLFSRL